MNNLCFKDISKELRVFFGFLLLLHCKGFCQYKMEPPKIVEPSMNTKAITTYGEYPMTGNNGLIDISIPLYEIKTKDLSLPITMSFHASGRKANEINGILGMRWTLNYGGVVTRTVKGRPDEYAYLNQLIIDPETTPSFETLYHSCPDGFSVMDYNTATKYDSEFDIFSYMLPNGKHGKFILKNENGEKSPMLIPYSAMKIELERDLSYNGYYKRIKITDTDGTVYIFGDESFPSNNSVEFGDNSVFDGFTGSIPTGWYLRRIIAANGEDEITFSYIRKEFREYNVTDYVRVGDRIRDNVIPWAATDDVYGKHLINKYLYEVPIEPDGFVSTTFSNIPAISSIVFNGGSILFNYAELPLAYNKWFLKNIDIIGISSFIKIVFSSSLNGNEKDIYYLDSVSFMGNSSSAQAFKKTYKFCYYEPASGEIGELWKTFSYKDWWGYYSPNGKSSEHRLIPLQNVEILRPSYGNNELIYRDIGYNISREASERGKEIGMLKSIQYPTGGTIEFFYESNRYDYLDDYNPPANFTTLAGPGLRVKKTILKSVNGEEKHKFFKYGKYEDGRGFIANQLREHNLFAGGDRRLEGTIMHYWDYVNPFQASKLQAGYRAIDYLSDSYLDFSLFGAPIKYEVVTEYEGDEQNPDHKTVRYYDIKEYPVENFVIQDFIENITWQRKFVNVEDLWKADLLIGKNYYKKVGNSFTLLKVEAYEYTQEVRDFSWDMPTYKHGFAFLNYTSNIFGGNPSTLSEKKYLLLKEYHEERCQVFGYGYRKYVTGINNLNKVTVKDYFNGGAIENITTYSYDPLFNLPIRSNVLSSDGLAQSKHYYYPFNFTNIPVYNSMVSKHILEPKVLIDSYKNEQFLASQKVEFKDWGNSLFAPEKILVKNGNNNYIEKMSFLNYADDGNIQSFSENGNSPVNFLYSYKGLFPVIKIEGINYSSIVNILGVNTIETLKNSQNPDVSEIATIAQTLRASLPDAHVTTYTYNPLVGMTSETDPRGVKTIFEYDDFGNLIAVKDMEGNIVTGYKYHLKP